MRLELLTDLLGRLVIALVASLCLHLDSPWPLLPAGLLYLAWYACDDFTRVRLNAR